MKKIYAYSFVILCSVFLAYSFSIYIRPAEHLDKDSGKASTGHLVWQKYNCQGCHQLYGLGGYLGPDLTNEYSKPGKGEVVIRAMLKSGVKQMPVFNLTDEEEDLLIAFLRETDASGSADPRNFITLANGTIRKK